MSAPDLVEITDPALADLAFAQSVCWCGDQWMDPDDHEWVPPSSATGSYYSAPADWIGHRLYKVWSTIEPPEGSVLARIADVEVGDEWALVSTTADKVERSTRLAYVYCGNTPAWLWPAAAPPPPEIPAEVAKYLLALGDVERAKVLDAAAGGEA